MKYPFTKQRDLKDCGVCCLSMITRYYGGGVSLEYLREITNTTRSGVTAFDLIEGSKKIGFSAYGVKGNINDLEFTPCIAHVINKKSYEHFIVIYKIDHKKKKLYIADPSNNHVIKISFDEFNKISSNVFILLKPNKPIQYVSKNKKFDDLCFSLLKDNISFILKLFIISFVITFLQIVLSFEFKVLSEYVVAYKTPYNLLLLSLLFIGIVLLKELTNLKRNNLSNKLNHLLDRNLFIEVYNHLLSLPYLYYKNRTTGEIVSRINDLESIRNIISKFFITLFFDLLLLFGTIFILYVLSSKLLIIIIISLIILSLLIFIFNKL